MNSVNCFLATWIEAWPLACQAYVSAGSVLKTRASLILEESCLCLFRSTSDSVGNDYTLSHLVMSPEVCFPLVASAWAEELSYHSDILFCGVYAARHPERISNWV